MSEQTSISSGPMREELIAPCGMNCRLCRAYDRKKKPCPGCYGDDTLKPKTRVMCKIKNCDIRISRNIKHCFQCEKFPCLNIKHLDHRYITRYGMSMIENLTNMKQFGMQEFLNREKEKWTCLHCGQVLCVHEESCIYCGSKWRARESEVNK